MLAVAQKSAPEHSPMTKLPMTGIMQEPTLGHPRSNRQENATVWSSDSRADLVGGRPTERFAKGTEPSHHRECDTMAAVNVCGRRSSGCWGPRSVARGGIVSSAIMIVAFVMSAGSPLTAHAQKSPLAAAAYARAQDHLAASRFAEAANEMEVAVRFEPRFAFGWYVLASASRRASQCDRAIIAYRRYAELRPSESDPHFGIGLCLKQIGDRAGAIAELKRYIAADARPASREFVETARKTLAALEASAPPKAGPPPAALLEARKLRDQGRAEDALARLQAAAAADPQSVEAQAELGHSLVSARRTRDAIAPLQRAVKLAPATAAAWYDLAFALREDGQTAAAVDAYRRYVTLRPDDPDAHYGLGRTLAILGRNDEALAAFRAYTALERRPTERRWLRKAQAEITRLEAARSPAGAASATQPPEATPAKTPGSHAATAPPPAPALALPPASLAPAPSAASAPPVEAPPARQAGHQ
jgi:tetratricopeptide (TPR) repeat protein